MEVVERVRAGRNLLKRRTKTHKDTDNFVSRRSAKHLPPELKRKYR
jgi:hypothetical protein